MYQERAFELHTHLYGCLREDELRWLAARKEPRWHIFSKTYESTYGATPDLENIFDPERADDLRKFSIYDSIGNFPQFQCCFDFVISVAHADQEEVYEVARRVSSKQVEPYAEYRMLFGPQLDLDEYARRVKALCEGFQSAEGNGYLVMSLWRAGDLASRQYDVLLDLMGDSTAVRERLVGIDFCAQEEGFPPSQKTDLFSRVLTNNAQNPARALAILYHVGESFQDKSLESAARWVFESAAMGVHRLGHCIALGQDPEEFLGTTRTETLSERIQQLDFEQRMDFMVSFDSESELIAEFHRLKEQEQEWLNSQKLGSNLSEVHNSGVSGNQEPVSAATAPLIDVHYSQKHVSRLRKYQDELMRRLAEMPVVIEVCPTSNQRIGAVETHPVHRFLEKGLDVVVGADDPGIFDTDLEQEFLILKQEGVSEESLEQMVERSRKSESRELSGRIS